MAASVTSGKLHGGIPAWSALLLALALVGLLLSGCGTGGGKNVMSEPMGLADRKVEVKDILAEADRYTAVVFGEAKTYGMAFLKAPYGESLELGKFMRVEKSLDHLKHDTMMVDWDFHASAELTVLRIVSDMGKYVDVGYAYGAVGEMRYDVESGTMHIKPYNPVEGGKADPNSPGGGY